MNLGTLTVTLGLDASQLAGGAIAMDNFAKKTTSSLAKVNSSLQRFGYLATTALTLPLVLAGKATFQLAKDYEYSIQKIVGLTGVAQTTVNNWSKDLLAIGPQLGRTPQELADALYFISSSGIKGAEAMNVLGLSAKAATAGLGDTKTVADLLTSALNAYAGTGLTAQYATDTLVAAIREGKAEASGFATSMGQIIPIAAQLGVRFDEVAGGMAAITLTGASSANAAVYLKGVFNSLLTASTKGEKALNSVGTSYAELRNILSNQGLIPLMQKLRDIQVKYGDELVSDVLPNIRALTGYLSLAGKNFKYNTELMNRVTNSTGSLGKAFAAVADTIKVRYDKAISQAQVSMISLGKAVADSLLPFLEKLVKKLEETTSWFNSLSESGKKMVLTIGGIAAALGPLSLLVSAFVWIIRGLVSVVGFAAKAFTTLRAVMMANPWIAAATAVLLVVGALFKYQNKVKQLAKEHDSFNTTLVSVNGTLKKLRDLLPTDYGSMTLNELASAQEAARQEWVAAEKLWKQGLKNKENFSWLEKVFGANKNNDAFMQEQSDKITQLKKQYEALGDSYYDVWQKSLIEAEIRKQEKLNIALDIGRQKLKEQQDALDALNLAWAKEGNLIKMATIAGSRFWWMLAKDKDKNDILNTKIPDRFDFNKKEWQRNDYTRLAMPAPPTLGGTTISLPLTEMENFNQELGLIALKNEVLGESFNTLREQTTFFKNMLSDLWDRGIRPGSVVMDDLTKRMKQLQIGMQVADLLSNAFSQMFNSIIAGGQKMSDILLNIVKSMISEIMAQFARMMITKIIMAVMSKGMSEVGGGVGNVIPATALPSGGGIGIRGLSLPNQSMAGGQVVFRIGQNELIGVLEKATKQNNIR